MLHLVTEPLRVILEDIHVVNEDRSTLAIVEALDEVDEGGLAAAGCTDERKGLARRQVDGQAVHDLRKRATPLNPRSSKTGTRH